MTHDEKLISRYQAITFELAKLNHTHQANTALLAVSKTHPTSAIKTLAHLGQRDFGENYLQEALPKIEALKELGLTWHYIGHIQRNKTRDIALHFDWVHTIERAIIAKRLSEQRQDLPPLNVLIQVNIDDETSKSGCRVEELDDLVAQILTLPNLTLRGLMIIPSKEGTDAFVRTKALFDDIKAKHNLPYWDTLSMGMSGDIQKAVHCGSTMVRVGTAIFGERDYSS